MDVDKDSGKLTGQYECHGDEHIKLLKTEFSVVIFLFLLYYVEMFSYISRSDCIVRSFSLKNLLISVLDLGVKRKSEGC